MKILGFLLIIAGIFYAVALSTTMSGVIAVVLFVGGAILLGVSELKAVLLDIADNTAALVDNDNKDQPTGLTASKDDVGTPDVSGMEY